MRHEPSSARRDGEAVGGTARVEPAADGAVRVHVAGEAATRALGRRLAGVLRSGDLVLLSGGLGAGKTTLTQGIGAGLGVRGQVASPTFIIAREHPSLAGGPDLVHVDAYRLGSLEEVDALDLDTSLAESVTVVEWGEGKVEALAVDRLEIAVDRPRGAAGGADVAALAGDDERTITLRGVGERWRGVDLAAVAAP